MSTVTVNVSFPKELLKAMDNLAKQQARTRSELLRQAIRVYIERRQRWDQILASGRQQAKRLGLKPQDVATKIAEYRREQARSK